MSFPKRTSLKSFGLSSAHHDCSQPMNPRGFLTLPVPTQAVPLERVELMDLILVIALFVVFLRWLQVETHRRWRWVMAATVVVSGVFTIGHIVNVWAG